MTSEGRALSPCPQCGKPVSHPDDHLVTPAPGNPNPAFWACASGSPAAEDTRTPSQNTASQPPEEGSR